MSENGDHVQDDSVVQATQEDEDQVELPSAAQKRVEGRMAERGWRQTLTLFGCGAAGTGRNLESDSPLLERELQHHDFPHARRRFRCGLAYILLASLAWAILLGCSRLTVRWSYLLAGALVLGLVAALLLMLTRLGIYERLVLPTSLFLSLLLFALPPASIAWSPTDISLVGSFAGSLQVVMLLYAFVPLPLYACLPLGMLHSAVYEIVVASRHSAMNTATIVAGKALLHLSLHLLGAYIFIVTHLRQRGNFSRLVQWLGARRHLHAEKENQDNMIHSLMPKSVADQVMTSHTDREEHDVTTMRKGRKKGSSRIKRFKGEMIFRTFNMNQMDNVSILFADIVGFTKMSSNKTAEQLVGLLNDLFGRFDWLCSRAGCEKISTLGDCYYCVAGCPRPRADHADCCVSMGLAMVRAIRQFDRDNQETVDMRVGVHTGSVLCGIVGTRRFKFDVWSNDVTLANVMESTGRPGRVHVSASCYHLLGDRYQVEPGDDVEDLRSFKRLIEHYDTAQSSFTVRHEQDKRVIKTYFIVGVKPGADVVDPEQMTSASSSISMETSDVGNDRPQQESSAGATEAAAKHAGQENSINGVWHPISVYGRQATRVMQGPNGKDDQVHCSTLKFSQRLSKESMEREKLDQQMIDHLNKDADVKEFFCRPPINKVTLTFNKAQLERDYRNHYYDPDYDNVASPPFLTLTETILSLILFMAISVSCFLMLGKSQVLVSVFVVCLLLKLLVVAGIATDMKFDWLRKMRSRYGAEEEEEEEVRDWSCWTLHNVIGIFMAVLPAAVVFSSLEYGLQSVQDNSVPLFSFCIILSLLNLCNFSMLCSMAKSIVATVIGVVVIIVISWLTRDASKSTLSQPLRFEIILDVLLFLVIIWLLNRESEVSHRLSFYGTAQADKEIRKMQENKEQADWLLHNIIPAHVSDVVKRTNKYSKHHQDVGVIFATIINFNEFYDEGFEGGREYLRVLNELVSDYEELLDRKCFKDVEKIKTISSSFMAASGLNEISRLSNKHPNAHLFALMDFAVELQNAVSRFNESILNFNFVLKVGYNFGEVIAGVIGTTKLLYDIWGDTVNIASRMYSTGKDDRIQVPESTLTKLDEMFEFEYRGEIFVKGKGDMKTYLYKCKRPDVHWD